ncbi:S1/P1 nuclease [Mucilaginibacter boryungensis]|uniref:S1/P1 nuclease n=1 Tax=Mucilaginibacter boryungensis TaxID=768480 RepID=A0ABR9XLK4_9SPHI|nr:S1/P1 nuclease [Mucilaginibacter boryungensis]MBE9668100.1 S1/P1 nuclease [Mucilaginibacter boryungensis]
MKKIVSSVVICIFSLVFISWGITGHRTIADIAERHLNAGAKAAVTELLDGQSMADASTWADEIRNQGAYRKTSSWHFLNLPLGLNHEEFVRTVTTMSNGNVYNEILKTETILKDKTASKDQKTEALKFLIHFVGDIHQPMHVSRAEDKGGNTIQVNFSGKGTNLHSLWDTKLIEQQGMSDQQLAVQYDHIGQQKIKAWESTPAIDWAWESYEISSRLYAEVDQMHGRAISDNYYQQHMPTIEERIEQGGIRLAAVLNEVFGNYKTNNSNRVPTKAENQNIICEKVYDGRYFAGSGTTLLNLGAAYPNQKLTVVIHKKIGQQFGDNPAEYFRGKRICVRGVQQMYNGKPEIVIKDASQISLEK